jgi:hypothetical protein
MQSEPPLIVTLILRDNIDATELYMVKLPRTIIFEEIWLIR